MLRVILQILNAYSNSVRRITVSGLALMQMLLMQMKKLIQGRIVLNDTLLELGSLISSFCNFFQGTPREYA